MSGDKQWHHSLSISFQSLSPYLIPGTPYLIPVSQSLSHSGHSISHSSLSVPISFWALSISFQSLSPYLIPGTPYLSLSILPLTIATCALSSCACPYMAGEGEMGIDNSRRSGILLFYCCMADYSFVHASKTQNCLMPWYFQLTHSYNVSYMYMYRHVSYIYIYIHVVHLSHCSLHVSVAT